MQQALIKWNKFLETDQVSKYRIPSEKLALKPVEHALSSNQRILEEVYQPIYICTKDAVYMKPYIGLENVVDTNIKNRLTKRGKTYKLRV